MKYFSYLGLFIIAILSGCSNNQSAIDQVDPFIGTGGHGHTYPGATLPFGMVQLSPDTRINSWDGCSGYHYSDSTILGFSHTHLSGTGVGDYGDIRLMPTTGKLNLEPGTETDPGSGYRSRFSHQQEQATPGYYQVKLLDYDINVELTATQRAGFHKYTFHKTDSAHIILDIFEGVTSDKIEFLEIQFFGDAEVAGVRRTEGWADDQRVYFYAVFSRPFDDFGIQKNNADIKTREKVYGDKIKAWVNYATENGEEILVKVGISPVSVEGARKNLMAEIPDWDFDRIKKEAGRVWEEQLNKIEVEGNPADKTVFYTAMYHAFIAPNLFMDVDGSYRAHDGKNYKTDKFTMYTVFSLWDTFRAAHPLYSIVEQERSNDFINSMLDMFKKGGLLPVWELAGNETNCMIGYHAIPVIADAYMKGIRGYKERFAYDAMRVSAQQDHFGLSAYKKYGYIPADKDGSSVSKTLEYAYDDWCIAQMAKQLGRGKEYKQYLQRAQYYKNIFDKETGFMRGKKNGMFVEPFDPAEVNFMLTEANTWQYNFFVPQDISGLMELLGGKEAFVAKLDKMFNADVSLSGRHQPDITGLIGQYAHGNEPSHHMAYLYDYAGQPWKTQEIVHKITSTLYTDKPDGLCGNEDCGQMSAWYVLSAMGFYPVTPGDTVYAIGTPVFEEAKIHLENGNTFSIQAHNLSDENFYILSATLNGKPYNKCYLSHQDLMRGGKLVFQMGNQPGTSWGTAEGDFPVSKIDTHLITPAPYFSAPSHAFSIPMKLEIKHIDEDAEIFYALDGEVPDMNPTKYKGPVNLDRTTSVKALAVIEGRAPSKVIEGKFIKIPGGRKVLLNSAYSSQYPGGGEVALIDGLHGSTDFTASGWQGYQGKDFDAVIDLGSVQRIRKISSEYLQNQRSWIFLPVQVEYLASDDGENFRGLGIVKSTISPRYEGAIIEQFTLGPVDVRARYIRVIAQTIVECPPWHISAGGKAWIFVDEVMVE